MPNFASAADFAREVGQMEKRLQRDALGYTEQMAGVHVAVAIAEARGDAGGDTRLSGWDGATRNLAHLDVKQLRTRTGHVVFPSKKAAGPWRVLEAGRNQGLSTLGKAFEGPGVVRKSTKKTEGGFTSYTKTGKIRISRRGGVKKWTGYTAAKRTASKASAKSDRLTERIAEKGLRRTIGKHFSVS